MREIGADPDHRPGRPRRPQDAGSGSSTPAARCSRAARASTGRPPRRSPSAPCCARAIRSACRARISGRGTFSQRHAVWVDQKNGAKYIPLDPGRPGPLRGARQPALRIRRARLRIWLFARRPADPGAVGGAVRRLRQRRAGDHRPVHRRRRGQVAARQRPRPAAAARLSRGRGPSTARRGPSASCSSAPRTICRSPTAPRRPIISTSCGAR